MTSLSLLAGRTVHLYVEMVTCDPLHCINQMEEFICIQRVYKCYYPFFLSVCGSKTKSDKTHIYIDKNSNKDNDNNNYNPCADPESFVRGGPTLIIFFLFFFSFRGDALKTTKSGQLTACQGNAIEMTLP